MKNPSTKLVKFGMNKLVRDKIYSIMEEQGLTIHHQILSEQDYIKALKLKLIEEAEEAFASEKQSELTEELADLLEVLYCLAEISDISMESIEAKRIDKQIEKGGFSEKIYIEAVEMKEDNPRIGYYKKSPHKYPLENL